MVFQLTDVVWMNGETGMATLAEQAGKLLDFNQKLDITLLDNVVGCMYGGEGTQVRYRFIYKAPDRQSVWRTGQPLNHVPSFHSARRVNLILTSAWSLYLFECISVLTLKLLLLLPEKLMKCWNVIYGLIWSNLCYISCESEKKNHIGIK